MVFWTNGEAMGIDLATDGHRMPLPGTLHPRRQRRESAREVDGDVGEEEQKKLSKLPGPGHPNVFPHVPLVTNIKW